MCPLFTVLPKQATTHQSVAVVSFSDKEGASFLFVSRDTLKSGKSGILMFPFTNQRHKLASEKAHSKKDTVVGMVTSMYKVP